MGIAENEKLHLLLGHHPFKIRKIDAVTSVLAYKIAADDLPPVAQRRLIKHVVDRLLYQNAVARLRQRLNQELERRHVARRGDNAVF